jgi:hypothetical protein
MKWLDSMGGRKAFLVFWFGNVTALLNWFSKVTGDQFVTIIIALVVAFVTGNVYEATKTPKEPQ